MSYLGSKGQSGVWQRIIGHMPRHDVYIEACLGSGQVMRRKPPSPRDIGIEINKAVLAEFRADMPDHAVLFRGSFYDVLETQLEIRDMGKVLIYFDLPYHPDTRTMSCGYGRYDWSAADHAEFLRWLQVFLFQNQNVQVMISGYPHDSYDAALCSGMGFRRVEYVTRHHKKTCLEVLWLSFDEAEPHFHSVAGTDRRERWRIKKKCERWTAAVSSCGPAEQLALLAAVMKGID